MTAETEVDVRVIAATHRELEEEVARGAFRSDLYHRLYRLTVIEVRLPALRQRREDIPLLIEHFVRRFAASQKKSIAGLAWPRRRRGCSKGTTTPATCASSRTSSSTP